MSKNTVGLASSRLIQDQLLALFKDRGYGTKARVERELGLYSGYFDNRRGRGDLALGVLVAALQLLEVDVGRFISDALADKADDDLWGGDPPPKVRSPAAATIARRYGIPIEESESEDEP